MKDSLIRKYDVAGPRYTSYPTVPYWDPDSFSSRHWISSVRSAFSGGDFSREISLYIHLPFCESLCTFCACHKRITKRHEVEIPYIESVLKEWKLYVEMLSHVPRIKEIHLGGGTPTFFAPEHLKMLIDGILKYAERAVNYEFGFEGHPNNTTEDHLKTLYGLGFRRVSFGIQDYAPHVQRAIHRVQPFEKVREVTDAAWITGFTSVSHDLVFGLPFQTAEDVENTMQYTTALKPDRIALYSYAHVPWISGNGQRGFREEDLPSGKEKRLLYETGKKLLHKAGYTEIGMDHFALASDPLFRASENGTLHRNFMGYTTSNTPLLIGLGVSAISDSWYGFAQNVKSTEEYHALVNNNILPIHKGHILNDEDLIIRRHILNLMCGFYTSWKNPDMWFTGIPEVLHMLKEPRQDGLVEIRDNEIRVTPAGKPFVRNICMAFDLRLQRKKPETRLFSSTV
ncbi:oxygen-independent coproporphyrinogen III oxidase [Sinomicrobium pectinilyticum]|uniref:Coproporphyrinogen-III oxidase n=1 Tax=Sinomicrobium pectinilyticum TaxID=1084421 RepID=A0A3N0EPX0_SINP1|nr:oxygen-independent coproporphyrinogen III oxidase [Sinomicrobium pectinilyticum]RNL89874.1 oxygen-independent coproporphyrinogen III oxidase [Sinomicrobium pectinilyticum]